MVNEQFATGTLVSVDIWQPGSAHELRFDWGMYNAKPLFDGHACCVWRSSHDCACAGGSLGGRRGPHAGHRAGTACRRCRWAGRAGSWAGARRYGTGWRLRGESVLQGSSWWVASCRHCLKKPRTGFSFVCGGSSIAMVVRMHPIFRINLRVCYARTERCAHDEMP